MTAATALVALALLAGCLPDRGHPLVRQVPNAPRVFDSADPAVLVWQGRTWLYGSTNNVRVPVREVTTFTGSLEQSRQDWARSPRDAMAARPAWVNPSKAQIWAPSVARIGNRFVMFFAAARNGATNDPVNDQCIGRAESASPTGPFTPWTTPVYCGLPREGAGQGLPASNPWGRGALDPEVVRGADGSLTLLVALSRTKDNIAAVRLDGDGRVVGGVNAAPRVLVSQRHPWHDGTDDGRLGSGAFLENPSMIYDARTGTYLLFYSAGQWYTPRYVTGFARCAAPTGPCTVDHRAPFLLQGNGRTGVGGLTAFTDASGQPRVAYATWQAGRENQVGPGGIYKRQTHWARLLTSAHTAAGSQTVWLG